MAMIQVDVVSAEKSMFSGEATLVVLPGESGELGILPGHTPLISRIRPGVMKIKLADGSEDLIFIAGGILEVQPGKVTVLSDTAIRAADLDEQKAIEARQRAEDALKNVTDKTNVAAMESELAMLAAQVHAARKFSKNIGRI